MKKWIFPLILFIVELVFSILFLTPNIVDNLPQFFIWIKNLVELVLGGISKLLNLPIIENNGITNAVVANLISLVFLDAIIITIYFVTYFLLSKKRKKDLKLEDKELIPKGEFDPILFEKRPPLLRLIFMWIPLNLWIIYFFVLNSYDLQEQFANSMPGLYSIFQDNIEFYNSNAIPMSSEDDAVKIAILVVGLVVVGFVYWMIFSIFAIMLKTPLAKAKALNAKKQHEKRTQALHEDEAIIENLEILEHAKFIQTKSIVETIATVDIKNLNASNEIQKRKNYFDDIADSVSDLGVQKVEKLYEVKKPITERKPLRIIYPSLDRAKEVPLEMITNNDDEKTKDEKSKKQNLVLNPKFDVLNEQNKSIKDKENLKLVKENKEEKVTIQPLKPSKLNKSVKVTPITPKHIPLKDLVSEENTKDVDNND